MKRAIRYSAKRAIGISMLIGLASLCLGVCLTFIFADKNLKQDSYNSVREADRQISEILDEAYLATKQLVSLASLPCGEVVGRLRETAAANRFIRAAYLAVDDRVYCSSLYGAEYVPVVDAQSFTRSRIFLTADAPVSGNSPVLTFRSESEERSALVGIDGRHISDVLRLAGVSRDLAFEVGDRWIGQDGSMHDYTSQPDASTFTELISDKYGYAIKDHDSGNTLLAYTFQRYTFVIIMLASLAAALGVTSYWLLGQVFAPSRELQRALTAREFVPYLQPVISSTTNSIVGCEILVRWEHPKAGTIPPDNFIPLAESSGKIIPMTTDLMRRTAELLSPSISDLESPFHVGVNVSSKHFESFQIVSDCIEFLDHFPDGTVVLVLELTERELIEPTKLSGEIIDKLRSIGVKIALDDFGTGNSSLSYLQYFHVDYVKIDRIFISKIGTDTLSVQILDTILDLALKLDLQVLAEGVETEEQRDYLGACGVDFMQGYFFARPMPIEEFTKQRHSS